MQTEHCPDDDREHLSSLPESPMSEEMFPRRHKTPLLRTSFWMSLARLSVSTSWTVTVKGDETILIGLDPKVLPCNPIPLGVGFQLIQLWILGWHKHSYHSILWATCDRCGHLNKTGFLLVRGAGAVGWRGSQSCLPQLSHRNVFPSPVSVHPAHSTGICDLWRGAFRLSSIQNVHEFVCGYIVVSYLLSFITVFLKYLEHQLFSSSYI